MCVCVCVCMCVCVCVYVCVCVCEREREGREGREDWYDKGRGEWEGYLQPAPPPDIDDEMCVCV